MDTGEIDGKVLHSTTSGILDIFLLAPMKDTCTENKGGYNNTSVTKHTTIFTPVQAIASIESAKEQTNHLAVQKRKGCYLLYIWLGERDLRGTIKILLIHESVELQKIFKTLHISSRYCFSLSSSDHDGQNHCFLINNR